MKNFKVGRIGRNLLITSSISGIVFIVFVIFCLWELDYQFSMNSKYQVEADEIETSLHTLYLSLLNQESGQRGYNLTGDPLFLESFQHGTKTFNDTANFLQQKVENKPNIKQKVEDVIEKGRFWQEQYGKKLIEMTKQGQKLDVVLFEEAKIVFDDFRNAVQETIKLTGSLREESRNTYISKIEQTEWITIIIAIFLILLNALIIQRQMKAIVQPVLLLNKSVKAYTKKDFSASIPEYKKEDELAELIENVNIMRLELNKKFSTIESLAELDGNTGVYNRRYFDQAIEVEWKKAIENESPLSLILFDIDYFKLYNDTYGHLKGDHCLKSISNKLNELFGTNGEIVARYGGEEFAIILPNHHKKTAYTKAEKLRNAIMDLKIPHKNSPIFKIVTASIGVATMFPSIADQKPMHLIRLADRALYKSKQKGRNQVTQFSDFTIKRHMHNSEKKKERNKRLNP
ncbi:sensor domain-containing diguanylate cyclase [Calidifontibacillus erzurumensis]|uniref:Diguanylate cyclase n=1 Tax=Calidifontibacillus erzurumensis TaxID=2741433 RepID=A0A8J8GFL8_9BACI|nr:diguanylate cyclase [Calidifontibacillus erzurumensis]NSL50926.1 diguanylate cyclase [Calidifontibacillus erzurumensis]